MAGEQPTADDEGEAVEQARAAAGRRPSRAATATPASIALFLAAGRRSRARRAVAVTEAFSAARIRASAQRARARVLGARRSPRRPAARARGPARAFSRSISCDISACSDRIETRLFATDRKPASTAAIQVSSSAVGHVDDAVDQQRQHRRVVGQDADVALGGAGDDHRGLARPDRAGRPRRARPAGWSLLRAIRGSSGSRPTSARRRRDRRT